MCQWLSLPLGWFGLASLTESQPAVPRVLDRSKNGLLWSFIGEHAARRTRAAGYDCMCNCPICREAMEALTAED